MSDDCPCGWTSDTPAAHCHRCHQPLDDAGQVFAHNHLFHPELDAVPERWPDGEVCVDILEGSLK